MSKNGPKLSCFHLSTYFLYVCRTNKEHSAVSKMSLIYYNALSQPVLRDCLAN